MATMPSLKIVTNFLYKDQAKLWSNRYHFTGTVPPDSATWATFADAVTASFKTIIPGTCQIREAIGYVAGSDLPVWSKTYALNGTMVPGSTYKEAPGDCAVLVRFSTDQRSVKNHPIYLFKYFHGALLEMAGGPDTPHPDQKAQVSSYAGSWVTGWSVSGTTHKLAGPRGAVAQGALVDYYITHRDFPD